MILEKQTVDLIFEIEISLDIGREVQNVVPPVSTTAPRPTHSGQYGNANLQNRSWSNTPYMAMLNS